MPICFKRRMATARPSASDTAVRPRQGKQESKSGWYPTKKQWIVIWVSAGLASACVLSEFLAGALVCIVIGALLVWQFSGFQGPES